MPCHAGGPRPARRVLPGAAGGRRAGEQVYLQHGTPIREPRFIVSSGGYRTAPVQDEALEQVARQLLRDPDLPPQASPKSNTRLRLALTAGAVRGVITRLACRAVRTGAATAVHVGLLAVLYLVGAARRPTYTLGTQAAGAVAVLCALVGWDAACPRQRCSPNRAHPGASVDLCVTAEAKKTATGTLRSFQLSLRGLPLKYTCELGIDPSCNHNLMVSSTRGKCNPDGSCTCLPGAQQVLTSGKCL